MKKTTMKITQKAASDPRVKAFMAAAGKEARRRLDQHRINMAALGMDIEPIGTMTPGEVRGIIVAHFPPVLLVQSVTARFIGKHVPGFPYTVSQSIKATANRCPRWSQDKDEYGRNCTSLPGEKCPPDMKDCAIDAGKVKKRKKAVAAHKKSIRRGKWRGWGMD